MRRAAATGRSQVVAIGVAQEYQRVFTATKSETGTGAVWFSYNRAQRWVTSYYFYVRDAEFGLASVIHEGVGPVNRESRGRRWVSALCGCA